MVDMKLVLLLLQASYCLTSAFMVDGDTCQNRCGATHDTTKICQCNSACLRFNDCCSDYQTLCTGGTATTHASGTCQTLAAISAELWANDVNRLSGSDVTVNYQTQVPDGTTADRSTQKFFTHVNEAKLATGTYKLLIDLLDNYDPAKGNREQLTAHETQEDNAFLDAILGTSVMNSLLKFLTCKGLVSSQSDLKAALKKIWFDFYPRSGTSTIPDTSGFEHVIVGEYKDSNTVNGFHNWVSFYEKEKSGSLNYFGYVRKSEPSIVGAAFSWSNHVKTMGSFFIGVSPEFELAVYTLCFMTNPGRACSITLNGHPVSIMSYSTNGHLATAYEGEGKPKNRTVKGKGNTTEGFTTTATVIDHNTMFNATNIGNDTNNITLKRYVDIKTVIMVNESLVQNTIKWTDNRAIETAYKEKNKSHLKKQQSTRKNNKQQKQQRKKQQLMKEPPTANHKTRKSKTKRKFVSENGISLKTIPSIEDQFKYDTNKTSM